MTGEKNRFTTQEKLWQLADDTLATPKHDEMVIYLLSKENIIKSILDIDFTEDIKISSEMPIIGRNGFIIGYWDIKIEFQTTKDYATDIIWGFNNGEKLLTNYTIWRFRRHNKFHPESTLTHIPHTYFPVFIEVKPKIKSFGETLRQLKTYQSYDPESVGRTYLFTADIGFKGAFESQGIKVIEYQG